MKTTILDVGITIELTISNNVIRRVQPPFTKLLMVRLLGGTNAYVELLVQIINNIFVSNFLLFCCIRNPT